MRGILIGNKHTADDWNLILNSKVISPPQPKTTYISIQDRDGKLDMSEALTGEIKYDSRSLSFTFLMTEGTYQDRENLISEIMSTVHGKRLEIYLDDDVEKCFIGRCEVKSYANSNAYGTIVIEATCDPYRKSANEKSVKVNLSSTDEAVPLTNNGAQTLIPTFIVSNTATIEYETSRVVLTKGTHLIDGIVMKTGVTEVLATGSGTLEVIWREGYL